MFTPEQHLEDKESTEASTNSTIFHVKVNPDPESHLDAGHFVYERVSGSETSRICVSPRMLEEFQRDSPGSHMKIWTLCTGALRMTGWRALFRRFSRTPPHGVESGGLRTFFSLDGQQLLVVEGSGGDDNEGSGCGGNAGSLTPRRCATCKFVSH